MFFWFKKKEIVLDCFTASSLAYEHARPDFAYKFFPEWFVKLPKGIKNESNELVGRTIKECRGFKRYYTANTIIIPCPYHIKIDVGTIEQKAFNWKIQHLSDQINIHGPNQFTGFVTDDYQHAKINSVWRFKTNKFVEFIWGDPIWNRSNLLDYTILPAVIDFKYQEAAAINLFFQYKKDPYEISFNLGDPLVHLAPLSDYKIKIAYHQMDPQENLAYTFLCNKFSKTDLRYPSNKKVIDATDKRNAMTRCPFHLR